MTRLSRIAPVLALTAVLAACGSPEDTADVVDGPATTDGTDSTDGTEGSSSTTGEAGPTTEEGTTTEGAAEEPTIDGGPSARGTVAGTTPMLHDVVVPGETGAIITVTPEGDVDIVAEFDGQSVDGGLSGERELFRVTGPDDYSLEVHGYDDDAAGGYTVTVAAG